jgi:hypothetical protein
MNSTQTTLVNLEKGDVNPTVCNDGTTTRERFDTLTTDAESEASMASTLEPLDGGRDAWLTVIGG